MRPKFITLALCLILAPITSMFAAPIQQTLKFSATVPADDFKIAPGTPWPADGEVTTLKYHKVEDTFDRYDNSLTIVSSAQDVTAKLQSHPELSNGKEKLRATVVIGEVMLSTLPHLIHPKGPAESTYPLHIFLTGNNRTPGTYAGDVVLIFDGS